MIQKISRVLYLFFAIFSVFSIPIFFLFYNQYQKAVLWCVLSIVLLLVLNIEKIKSFKLWGLEAELKEKITEANETIEYLREVALAIAVPVYDNLASRHRGYSTSSVIKKESFDKRWQKKKNMDAILRKLGFSEQEIKKAANSWNQAVANQIAENIFTNEGKLVEENINKIWSEIVIKYQTIDDFIPYNEIEKFITNNNLASEYRTRTLKDYYDFITYDKINDPKALK